MEELSAMGATAAREAVKRTYDLSQPETIPGRDIEEFGIAPQKAKVKIRRRVEKVA